MGLKSLDVSGTPVANLTPLAKLADLQILDIRHTQATDLSPLLQLIRQDIPVKWVAKFWEEHGIFVQGCSFINPPTEVVRRGNPSILNYFNEIEAQGIDHLYEAKLLIVGEGGAGKTSLLRRLYQPGKPLPEEKQTTKGIDIHHHEFKLANGRNFRLNVWDFGGQEIYHATHQFFLTKRSLYVLLDDTRNNSRAVQDEGFKYWLEVVDQLSGHSPVVIFQNERGGRSKTIDLAGIKSRFDNVKECCQGNLEYADAADKLREDLEFFAQKLSHIGEELPARWVSIRAEIETEAQHKPYISQQNYFDIYAKYLPFNRDKALHLSRYFHDLGVFLHFQDDMLLAKSVILQNTWATEAVFKILDDEIVKKAWGHFSLLDCQRVWEDSIYADMHAELLALMLNFELCYLLQDTKSDIWLAPQLLPPSKPSDLANWEQSGDLVLRYRYKFMPKGLISRLMVRMHRFVPKPDLGWVTGVLFERDRTQVLVEIPSEGGEIALRARGPERKELLSVIAADLDALNDSFPGLRDKIEKLVPCICSKCRSLAMPEYFEQKRLLQRKEDNRLKVECPSSYEDVDVLQLLDGIRVNHLPIWAKEKLTGRQEVCTYDFFDVFLSHNSQDKPAVRELAQALKLRGLRVWLDEEQLVPGRPWLEGLETIIQTTRTAAVLFGNSGLGPWEEPEMRACLNQFVKRNLPVIPVLLPDAHAKPVLPLFLQDFTWVDFRRGLTDGGLDTLEWGITGIKPEQSSRPAGNGLHPKPMVTTPKNIFICYSKHDETHKNTLLKHLSGLCGKIATWNDKDLLPGEYWNAKIKEELEKADIVLYLVSSDSMATEYIQKIELPLIEARCQKGVCKLVPVIVRFCDWTSLDFAKYNALPDKGKPITSKKDWNDEDEAWLKVVEGVKRLIEAFKKDRPL